MHIKTIKGDQFAQQDGWSVLHVQLILLMSDEENPWNNENANHNRFLIFYPFMSLLYEDINN